MIRMKCEICDSFSETQKDMLATPTYHITKDKKSGILVSPDDVTVIASVEVTDKDLEPSFQSPPHDPASAPSEASSSFVTSDQLKQISDQWVEKFAHFEALLSRGNVFSTPKTSVKPMPRYTIVSDSVHCSLCPVQRSGGCPGRG